MTQEGEGEEKRGEAEEGGGEISQCNCTDMSHVVHISLFQMPDKRINLPTGVQSFFFISDIISHQTNLFLR